MPLSLFLRISTIRRAFGAVTPPVGVQDDLLLTQAGDVIITQDGRGLIKQEASFNLITQSGVFFTTQDDRIFETS
jgi:hypothetical protein